MKYHHSQSQAESQKGMKIETEITTFQKLHGLGIDVPDGDPDLWDVMRNLQDEEI